MESGKDMFDLTGKTALITGSTKGIGKAIAEHMALFGAKVVVSSRRADACEQVANEINNSITSGMGEAKAIPCNITNREDLNNLVSQALEGFGKIDVLVCNAAVNVFFGSVTKIGEDAFDKTIDANIKSNLWLCRTVLPGMAERRDGVIIIISSVVGLKGSGTMGTYGITKAADIALVRNIAVEFGPRNIRCNAIIPGLVKTDFSRALWDNKEIYTTSLARTPLGRIGMPKDIAGAAIFLASEAGSFVTGQTIIVDGGMTIT